jgi:hypothetical protein
MGLKFFISRESRKIIPQITKMLSFSTLFEVKFSTLFDVGLLQGRVFLKPGKTGVAQWADHPERGG